MTTAPDPQLVIQTAGINGILDVQPVGGGMSGAALWRVHRQRPETDLLLRLFPNSGMADVQREAQLQRHAFAGGIPAPVITFVGDVASCPVIVMGWVDGRTMLDQIVEEPERAEELGRQGGLTLAMIHALPVPEDWQDGGTMAHWFTGLDPWLIERVQMRPAQRVLVHADYHPVNILTDGTSVRSVLDWTNADVAHPLIDLGRTFACLRLGAHIFAGSIGADAIDAWWRGLIAGYGAKDRSIEELAPFFAFGLATMVEDRLQVSSRAIPDSAIEALILERDAWLDLARRASR